jgi:mannose-6-phosphate isomerase-like protein (cupin superfamily)
VGRLHRVAGTPCRSASYVVPRYLVRRLTKLPTTEEGLRRHTVLNAPGMLDGVSFHHEVLRPGCDLPVQVEDDQGTLIFTLSGRGVMLLDGDRVEVAANDLVHIPPAVTYALKTLGASDWVYVVVQGPPGAVRPSA